MVLSVEGELHDLFYSPITIIGSLVGNVTGFVAKQYVLIKGLEPVRKAIDEAVTTVAKQHFGVWAGTIFGHQAGLVLALPAFVRAKTPYKRLSKSFFKRGFCKSLKNLRKRKSLCFLIA